MSEMITDHLVQVIDRHADEAIEHLQCIVILLQGRPIEADFFQGMINRIKSGRKRICRQIVREGENEKEKD